MAYTKTLLQLRTSFLIRGGWERSSDITPAVANELINDALEESYNIIVKRWDDYYTIVGPTFVTIAGQDTYPLPSDNYKLRKVEVLTSGVATDPQARWARLFSISVDDTHKKHIVYDHRYKYRQAMGNLILVPPPSSSTDTLRVFYILACPQLVADTDSVTFDVPVEQKLLFAIAMRDAYDRQDLPTDSMEAKIAKLTAQLASSSDHDAGEPFYLGRRTDDGDGEYEY